MNPNTKVFINGKQIVPRTSTGKFTFRSKLHRAWAYFYRMFLIETGALFTVAVLISVGGVAFSTHEINAQTVTLEAPTPILDRIAACESGNGKPGSGRQFDAKGNVIEHLNHNGSLDVGKFQLNLSPAHVSEMAKLGDDPLTLEGNTAYAKFLYENRGTGDWASSAHCWMQ